MVILRDDAELSIISYEQYDEHGDFVKNDVVVNVKTGLDFNLETGI
jgi:hypothetical protein